MYKKTDRWISQKIRKGASTKEAPSYILYYASYDSSTIDITRQPVR